MAVPKKKVSAANRGNRRSHDSLSSVPAGVCPNCGEPVLPHHVCGACGMYNGKQVVAAKDQEEVSE